MSTSRPVEKIRDFVLILEKCLTTRRLYAPHMAPYKDASAKLFEKCREAVGEEGFTLRVGATDLLFEKTSLINRPKREECFFFPLYRDGLRELSFAPGVEASELEALLSAFEAEEKRVLGPSDDTVTFLWRCDLTRVGYAAIDGIGDTEGEGTEARPGEDYRALVADLAQKIKDPAPPVTGQGYAFVLDADVKVAASDLHYEATTTHRSFEDNPPVLRLSREEAAGIYGEMGSEREAVLLARFVEILLAILTDPAKTVAAGSLAKVFRRLIEGYWSAREFDSLIDVLLRLRAAAQEAPHPESRTAAHEIVSEFLDADRLRASFELLKDGTLRLATATRLWEHAAPQVWDLLIEFWARLGDGELRAGLTSLLKSRVAFNPELLRGALGSPDPGRVRAGLALLDEKIERSYARELIALASNPDEGLRLKGLAAAGRIGGPEALEAIWKVLEGDPSRAVRLYAFRVVALSRLPGLAERLHRLIGDPGFASRPAWEREKYARLLGTVAGDAARPVFESMIPAKRWFWQPQDLDAALVALHGLTASGAAGRQKVQALASGGGKLGEIAARVLEGLSKRDPAEMTIPPSAGMAVPAFARRPTGAKGEPPK